MTDREADQAWAWRITDQSPERFRLSTGIRAFAGNVPEWEVAAQVVEEARLEHPACGALDVLLWAETSPIGPEDAHLVPWDSDRDPHGEDRAPADAAVFTYAMHVETEDATSLGHRAVR
ncbi:hypothetical protein [Streptomyces sp. NPDC092295]|uniref:hypothetical protein n=1 Tax=Streptomyces sp. NPDC092295 TaxID=3366011 RepID=UPI0037F5A946